MHSKLFPSLFFLLLGMVLVQCSDKDDPAPDQTQKTDKAITSFSFLKSANPLLDKDYAGTITNNSIIVNFPHGYSASSLVATFTLSNGATATIGGTTQVSGQTANDYSSKVTFTIAAEDNSTSQYVVELNKIGVAPNTDINKTTGHYMQNQNFVWTDLSDIIESVHGGYWGDEFAARAFYDFDKDGDKDLAAASLNFGEFDDNVAIDIHYYKNNSGTYEKDQSVYDNVPQYVHARQMVLGDFDNNGWMDFVIGGHGFDMAPFPGEQQKIMLNENGTFTSDDLPLPKANDGTFTFNHSVAAGDIDNDGDIDLFFTNNKTGPQGIFMINDGKANFTYDESRLSIKSNGMPIFTSALYDINGDGYLDLVMAGHDTDSYFSSGNGSKPIIFWGNYTGKYSEDRSLILPITPSYGVTNSINFIDYNKDGRIDLLLGKTGDGTVLPFYQGFHMQLLENTGTAFTDVSSKIQDGATTTGGWVIWFLVHDIDDDGDMDITTEDKFYNLQWRNDDGTFVKF